MNNNDIPNGYVLYGLLHSVATNQGDIDIIYTS